jgi:hypothetical protein
MQYVALSSLFWTRHPASDQVALALSQKTQKTYEIENPDKEGKD